jgi:hypothetical protein
MVLTCDTVLRVHQCIMMTLKGKTRVLVRMTTTIMNMLLLVKHNGFTRARVLLVLTDAFWAFKLASLMGCDGLQLTKSGLGTGFR